MTAEMQLLDTATALLRTYLDARTNAEVFFGEWVWNMPRALRKKLSEFGAIELNSTAAVSQTALAPFAAKYPTRLYEETLYVDPTNYVYSRALRALCAESNASGTMECQWLRDMNEEGHGDIIEAALGAEWLLVRRHELTGIDGMNTIHLVMLRKRIQDAVRDVLLLP